MRVKILGTAAGGGFPQWNCACANCRALRDGSFRGKPRTQTQVAISGDGRAWFLLGASPDLRIQIEATPELRPSPAGSTSAARCSPIAGAVLANADLDHVLGLLMLRELQPLSVHSTASVRRILQEDNSMFAMLDRVEGQLAWNDFAPGTIFSLLDPRGRDSRLRCRSISLGAHYPAYVGSARRAELVPWEASLGLIFESAAGRRLAYLPAVPQIDDSLLKELDSTEVLLFDGTFWSDDELIRTQGSGKTAGEMGHVPVSSDAGSLHKLAHLNRPRKIYIHVNNTNPMLNEAGAEHRQVLEAGWEIAEDGCQFDL